MTPAVNHQDSVAARDSRELLNYLWVGVALPSVVVGLWADWYGQVQLICLIGLITSVNLFKSYWLLKAISNKVETLYHVKDGEQLPAKLRLYSLMLAAHAATATFITDLHIHFATSAPAGLSEGLRSFDWWGTWELAALMVLSAIAFVSGTIRDPKRFVSRAVKLFSTIAFATSIYPLVCGLWGREALVASTKLLHVGLTDLQAGLATQQEAAVALYAIQNPYVFYFLFFVAPVASMLYECGRWLLAKRPKPTLAGSGLLTCCCLIVAAGSVAGRTPSLWRFPMAGVFYVWGEPPDRVAAPCLLRAREPTGLIQCMSDWQSTWAAQLAQMETEVMRSLSKRDQLRFQAAERSWHQTYVERVQPADSSVSEEFRAVFNRGTNIRARVRQLRRQLHR